MELERIFGGKWGIGFCADGLSLTAPTKKEASRVAELEPETLAKWAHNFGKDATLINYPGGESYRIPVAMAKDAPAPINLFKPSNFMSIQKSLNADSGELSVIGADTIQSLWIDSAVPINKPLLALMERLIESDRPMALLANDTDRQVWINELAARQLQSSGSDCVRRTMRHFWEGGDLAALHQTLRDTTQPFEHSYRAILNDAQRDVWFAATARYEPIEIDGKSFRLSINQDFQIIGQTQLQPALTR